MKKNNFEKLCTGIFIPIIFFLFLEIFFTVFLLFYMNDYHPIIKYFISNNSNKDSKTIEIKVIKSDKYTKKMLPGIYKINDYEVKINNKGFRGEDFSIKNLTGCRIISFGGSNTFGTSSKKHYPIILEEILKDSRPGDTDDLRFGHLGSDIIKSLAVFI